MSLINDALKRARTASSSEDPALEPPPLRSLQPVAQSVAPATGWFISIAVIFLIVAGIFFVGFAMAHRSLSGGKTSAATKPALVKKPVSPPVVAEVPPATPTVPAAQPAPPPVVKPVVKPVAKSVPAVHAVAKPKLQGIFYSPTAPAAIVDGRTVRVGDQLSQYHVVEITKLTVTLVGADGKTVKLSMDN